MLLKAFLEILMQSKVIQETSCKVKTPCIIQFTCSSMYYNVLRPRSFFLLFVTLLVAPRSTRFTNKWIPYIITCEPFKWRCLCYRLATPFLFTFLIFSSTTHQHEQGVQQPESNLWTGKSYACGQTGHLVKDNACPAKGAQCEFHHKVNHWK